MREMRLYKREIRDPEIIREILEECSVVRLGTRDEEGMFIVPVNFGYEFYEKESGQALTLFIHGAGEGRKDRTVCRYRRYSNHGWEKSNGACGRQGSLPSGKQYNADAGPVPFMAGGSGYRRRDFV